MTSGLKREITAFLEAQQSLAAEARQMAALQIACHFDLAEALAASPEQRRQIVARLERTIEKERQRGARRHWSYDLNRHIALKQVLDRLRGTVCCGGVGKRAPSKDNGARRRRRHSAQ